MLKINFAICLILIIITCILLIKINLKRENFVTSPVNKFDLESQNIDMNFNKIKAICKNCINLKGPIGNVGSRGKSAYDYAKEIHIKNGKKGSNFPSKEEWIKMLKGKQGDIGMRGPIGENGNIGNKGISAYENNNDEGLSKSNWVNSLKGEKGEIGIKGVFSPTGTITPFYPSFKLDISLNLNINEVRNLIPNGWALCDGNSYFIDDEGITKRATSSTPSSKKTRTPNLLGSMILGSGTYDKVNSRGGKKNVVLEVANLPSHNHNNYTTEGGEHSHIVQENSMSHGHNESFMKKDDFKCNENCVDPAPSNYQDTNMYAVYNKISGEIYQNDDGTYNLDIDPTLQKVQQNFVKTIDQTDLEKSNAKHSHEIPEDSGHDNHSVGSYGNPGSATHNNMPPYYSVVYIMKL